MRKSLPLLIACGLFAVGTAHAQLAHHYNLTDGTDSVAGANGTLNGSATFTNGMLQTNLTNSNTDTTSYLSLPASVGTGITGDFSIEAFTTSTLGTATSYATLFSFSSSNTNFILFNANRPGQNPAQSTVDFQQAPATGTNAEINVGGGSPLLADGLEHDIVITYLSASGDVAIYNNGVQVGAGNIGAGFSFQAAAAGGLDGINGHAPFNDPVYAGSTDDFRIFSSRLTQAQVTRLDAAGANASNVQIGNAVTGVPEPSAWQAALAGAAVLWGLQRFRRTMA